MKRTLLLLALVVMAVPSMAQLLCDYDNDGMERAADLVHLVSIYNASPDDYYVCDFNCDADDDDLYMTIADFGLFVLHLRNPMAVAPIYDIHPGENILRFESAAGAPGDQLSIPLYMSLVDTIICYELLAQVDNSYLNISNFIPSDDLDFSISSSGQRLHIYYLNCDLLDISTYVMPGNYYLGELVVELDENITHQVTTSVSFSGCPEDNFHTGMANMTFFVPQLIDGVVTITPTGVDDPGSKLPLTVGISAYPNPFNGNVNIQVSTYYADQVQIFDILGRQVVALPAPSGESMLIWDGTDSKGKQVDSGMYFAKLGRAATSDCVKLMYMK